MTCFLGPTGDRLDQRCCDKKTELRWVAQSSNLSAMAHSMRKSGVLGDVLEQGAHSFQAPAVYSVLEAAYESTNVMLVLLNHFIARQRNQSPILFLDVGLSRDGYHVSGLPQFDSAGSIVIC